MKKDLLLILSCVLLISNLFAQSEDVGKFRTYPAGFYYKVIMRDIIGDDNFSLNDYKSIPVFKMDFGERIYPVQISDYITIPHSEPVSQGNSGTCWAYSATSFMEAESYRITKNKTKLSEMFTVYWEYIERAQHFVKTKGETFLGEGSESNAILRIMRNHGMMPYVAYHGLKYRLNYNDHSELFSKYETYLSYVKENELWNEDIVVDSIKKILDFYIGTPPEKFEYKDKEYTPESFMTDYMKLNPNHYFSFMSTKEFAYNGKQELVENDNWWHSNDYYNISLEDFMTVLNNAVKNGFTVSLCGDVSEPGYDQLVEVAVIPSFDIPAEYINEDARQLRLSNNCTTDDHCIHIVGYKMVEEVTWYLIKDSGSGAFDGKNKGYRFYHEDYVKLKMMNLMMNVEPARIILDRIIK